MFSLFSALIKKLTQMYPDVSRLDIDECFDNGLWVAEDLHYEKKKNAPVFAADVIGPNNT